MALVLVVSGTACENDPGEIADASATDVTTIGDAHDDVDDVAVDRVADQDAEGDVPGGDVDADFEDASDVTLEPVDDPDVKTEPDAPAPVDVRTLSAVENPTNPLSYYVFWSTDEPTDSESFAATTTWSSASPVTTRPFGTPRLSWGCGPRLPAPSL
jgi:hypothetical protein